MATCDGDLGVPGDCTDPGCGADLLVDQTTKLDATTVQGGTFPDQATTTGRRAQAFNPQFAFGKSTGNDAVLVTYYAEPATYLPDGGQTVYPNPKLRFGTKVGNSWTFETISHTQCDVSLEVSHTIGDPENTFLSVDASGAPLLLLSDQVLRKRDTGDWEPVCLPGPTLGGGQTIATDASGAWYVARVDGNASLFVSRRDAAGAWWTEQVTGALALNSYVFRTLSGHRYTGVISMVATGGTLHLAYVHRVSSGPEEVYYARRVGTSWEQHLVAQISAPPAGFPFSAAISSLLLKLDSCGRPHVATYGRANYYLRWTAAGWRGAQVSGRTQFNGAICDAATLSGGLALTSSTAYLSEWTCYSAESSFFGLAIPLR